MRKNLGSVRSSRNAIHGGYTQGFLHRTVLVDAHGLARLFSSPLTCTSSNSVTHFVSMTCKRDKNLGSVRSSRHVIHGACTCFFHETVLVYAHALAKLFSSPSTFTASNSVKHLFSMTCTCKKNLGSVLWSRHVIQGACTWGFFTAQY